MRRLGWTALPWVVAVPVVLLSTWLTGSLVAQQEPGLTSTPMATLVLLPVARVAADLSGIVVVGLLLVAALLVPATPHRLTPESRHLTLLASWTSVIWLASTTVAMVLTLSDVFALPASDVTNPVVVTSFLTQVSIGQIFLTQLTAALVVLVAAPLTRRPWSVWALVMVALTGMAARGAAGHAGIGSDHESATMMLSLHIAAVSLWVGGLIAIGVVVLRGAADGIGTVRRFSALALWSATAVAVTGVAQATIRLASPSELFTSAYGIMLVIKIELLAVLIALGWFQRSRSLPLLATGQRRALLTLGAVEIAIMGAVLAISVTLSRTPSPSHAEHDSSHIHTLPPIPQNALQFLAEWRIDVVLLTITGILAGGYLAALRARGARRWRTGRTVAFVTGLVLLVIVTCTGIGTYAPVLLGDALPRTLALLLLVPTLLIAGRPDALVLDALEETDASGRWQVRIASARRHLVQRPSAYPEIPTIVALTLLVALYGTRMYPVVMTGFWTRTATDLATLLTGLWACSVVLCSARQRERRRLLPLLALGGGIVLLLLLSWPRVRLITPSYYAGFSPPYVEDVYLAQQVGVLISLLIVLGWFVGARAMARQSAE